MEQWDALVDSSIERATATAEKWRTGLAAFVTVVTSVLLLKGPDAQKIALPWNLAVVIPLVAGAGLMILGLWRALEASAPSLTTVDYTSVVATYGTVRAYLVAAATAVTAQVDKAKFWVAWALVAFAFGIVAWWLVPIKEDAPKPLMTVTDHRGIVVACGTFVESKNNTITLRPRGTDTTVTAVLRDVSAIAVADKCGESSDGG
ncbi:hypothetical protein H5P33_05070 [Mycolicibacterium arabiense]|nr:hypothetical protein [Mycolicibacterium arabiense]MCV7372082.1 hypothetical protein [Mycolicibacterium arabiense]